MPTLDLSVYKGIAVNIVEMTLVSINTSYRNVMSEVIWKNLAKVAAEIKSPNEFRRHVVG